MEEALGLSFDRLLMMMMMIMMTTCHYTITHSFIYHRRCLHGLTSLNNALKEACNFVIIVSKMRCNLTESVKVNQFHYTPEQALSFAGA